MTTTEGGAGMAGGLTQEEAEVFDAACCASYEENITALLTAAKDLDALWKLDAARGKADAPESAEYERLTLAPILREVALHLETIRRMNEPDRPHIEIGV